MFGDEIDSDGELLWKGIDVEREAHIAHEQQEFDIKVAPEIEVPLYFFSECEGLIEMINGDKNNALQCVLQVLLEIDELARYFSLSKAESQNELYI